MNSKYFEKFCLSLDSFTPLLANVHLLPDSLQHISEHLVIHSLGQVYETMRVSCSHSSFAIVYKTPKASYCQYYLTTQAGPCQLKGTFKVFQSNGKLLSVHLDGWKRVNSHKKRLWVAFTQRGDSNTLYLLWTFSDQLVKLDSREVPTDKHLESAVSSPLVECLKLFQSDETAQRQQFLTRRRRGPSSCPEKITVDKIEFSEVGEGWFRCLKCLSEVHELLLPNHASIHRRGRKSVKEELKQTKPDAKALRISIPIGPSKFIATVLN